VRAAASTSVVRAEPNVTPMIDVMLVLLIIFMVAIPALLSGVPAQPPEARNLREHPEEPGDLTLGIDRTGRYYLNKVPLAAAELPERLRAFYTGRPDDTVLFVRADKGLQYARVLDALDVAARSGVRVVGMISEREPEPEPARRR